MNTDVSPANVKHRFGLGIFGGLQGQAGKYGQNLNKF